MGLLGTAVALSGCCGPLVHPSTYAPHSGRARYGAPYPLQPGTDLRFIDLDGSFWDVPPTLQADQLPGLNHEQVTLTILTHEQMEMRGATSGRIVTLTRHDGARVDCGR